MKVKVLIVEDEVIIADEIENALVEAGYDVIGNVGRGETAVELAKTKEVDIVLMDIKLKGSMNGIETAQKIQAQKKIPIVYLTDISEKKVWEEAKETNAAACLLKPFEALEVEAAFEIALKHSVGKESFTDTKESSTEDSPTYIIEDRVYLRDGTKHIRILPEEILFIKGSGSSCEIHTTEKKIILSYNLTQIKQEIPFKELERIHRSYIINIQKITSFEGNRVFLDKLEMPIGESYKDDFKKRFRFV